MKRLLYASVALVALTATAVAAPISGEISVYGDDVFTLGPPPAITFSGLGNVGGTSGSFTEVANCDDCVTMINELTAASTGTLFSATSGGNTAAFTITPGSLVATISTNPNPALDAVEVTGSGEMSLTGFDTTPSSFVLTTQGPADENVTFSATATAAVVPAPPIGQGLVVTGFMAVTMLLFRRRWLG